MENVGGVFIVLIGGCALSFIVAILEFLWNVRKVAVDEKVWFSLYKMVILSIHAAIIIAATYYT